METVNASNASPVPMNVTSRVRSLWQRVRQAPLDKEVALWSRATVAGRATSTALALVCFMGGLTLDDLHLFRVPMVYVGAGAAILAFAFLPPLVAQRVIARAMADAPEQAAARVESTVVRRRAIFGVTVALFIAWLVLFSSGVTPRW